MRRLEVGRVGPPAPTGVGAQVTVGGGVGDGDVERDGGRSRGQAGHGQVQGGAGAQLRHGCADGGPGVQDPGRGDGGEGHDRIRGRGGRTRGRVPGDVGRRGEEARGRAGGDGSVDAGFLQIASFSNEWQSLSVKLIETAVQLGTYIEQQLGINSVKQDEKKEIGTSTSPTTTNIDSIQESSPNSIQEYWTLNVRSVLTTKVDEKIFIEIASTSEKQEKGLSGKSKLMEFVKDQKIRTEGLLFVFDKPQILNFWMKNMKFDLDIIWLDENLKIVHIEKNALASSYDKQNPANSTIYSNGNNLAKYVLEINVGLSSKLNLKIGDSLIMQ